MDYLPGYLYQTSFPYSSISGPMSAHSCRTRKLRVSSFGASAACERFLLRSRTPTAFSVNQGSYRLQLDREHDFHGLVLYRSAASSFGETRLIVSLTILGSLSSRMVH